MKKNKDIICTNKSLEYDKLDNILTNIISNQMKLQEDNVFFKAALNVGNVYIVDMDTHTILFANDRLKGLFGNDIEGKICYEVFQELDHSCNFCTNDIIKKQPNEPYYWVFYNEKTKETYIVVDVYIKHGLNGDSAHLRFEIAIPINSKLKQDLITTWTKH